MSVRRALVDCAVLSLQDTCIFYPCCKGCFSRIEVEQQDTTRCRCSKCGYSCLKEQLDYRYRLSLKVARDRCIFGVTVFGNSLNPFFGIDASGLQKLVENVDGPVVPSTRFTLLLKAVKDCFIGRHFIFGLKSKTQSGPWFGDPVPNGSNGKDSAQFVASQMILPKTTGLEGCTVVSYYRILLQKASEFELGCVDHNKTPRPPDTTLLINPDHSPTSSFNVTLSASDLPSQSPYRSLHRDCTRTPFSVWEQSLGVITSSAEQEEGCSTQDSGDESSRQRANSTTPHPGPRRLLEKHKVTEDRPPLLPLDHSFYSSPSFAKYPDLSHIECAANSPNLNTRVSPANEFSRRTFLSSSLAWDDLPFSESLTEFLCKENKETVENNLETTNVTVESTSVCQRKAHVSGSQSQILLDITNTRAPTGSDSHDLSDQEDEEHPGGDTYNCSADLFSRSLYNSTSTEMLSPHAEPVRTTTEACTPFSTQDEKQLGTKNTTVTYSTPDTQKLKSGERYKRDSLVLHGAQDFDFVPPSQSTPIVKVGAVPPVFGNLHEVDSKKQTATTSVNCQLNIVHTNQLCQVGRESTKENLAWNTKSSRRSYRLTPKRSFWKPDNHRFQAQQQQSVERAVLNLGSTGTIKTKCDSTDCNVTVCDFEHSEVAVPPSPPESVTLRRRRRTGDSRGNVGFAWEGQHGDGVYCKRTLLDGTPSSSFKSLVQVGKCDSETVDAGSLDGSKDLLLDEENHTCDWSRDLFSDSCPVAD
ncbi:uncharacterized protein ddias isoform X2 [Mugil cephalus]|uniref:uncharacterized protein ddias isoform X2 n=1 Tax=Mugil cephalus TaxID=48193 RepID=UPI001FB7B710|nr:uncharacterized protein ddias isoform X2 [Mugil cephalus]